MRPELLQKLEGFVKAGLILYGPQPKQSPGLMGYPECDKVVQNIANRVWGNIEGKTVLMNSYGKGKIFFGMSLAELFAKVELKPDIVMPTDFVYTHRKEADTDIYFIANQKDEPRKCEISFSVENKQPEFLDPLTGEHRKLHNFQIKDGRTIVPLEFSRAGSCFIVFKKGVDKLGISQKDFPVFIEKQIINGKWDVLFSSPINPPFSKTFEKLADWTSFDDKAIKYFSGRATYTIIFDFGGKLPGKWYINLGKVESLARVRLNGKDVNTLWCYPYRVNVSDFLKASENKLEIEIVNQWWNQLIGDEQPEAIRKSNVSARLFWKASDKLVPAGLLGPLVLEAIQ